MSANSLSRFSVSASNSLPGIFRLNQSSYELTNYLQRRKIQVFSQSRSRGLYTPSQLIKRLDLKSRLSQAEEELSKHALNHINSEIEQKSYGRLFAVVSVAAKQFKVTQEDLILIQHNFPGEVGSRIRLDKVLVVGSSMFTAIGRPLLQKDQVTVLATVAEKTLSHQMIHFRSIKRSPFQRFNFYRVPFTVLRINSIEINRSFEE